MYDYRTDRQLVKRILAMICCALSRMESCSHLQFPHISYITDVRQYICSHYRERLTAELLAEKFRVSRTKLMCDFRMIVYTTLNLYITNERLLHAQRHLSDGKSVSEAAELSGFESERNFRRCFVKHLGMTPSEYRRRGESLNCSTNQGNKKGHDKKTVERQPKKLYRGATKQSKEHHP